MNHESLHELVSRRPFEPFSLRLSNGDVVEIRHPEFAMLMKSKLVVGVPDTDRVVICSLLHIAGIETLQQH